MGAGSSIGQAQAKVAGGDAFQNEATVVDRQAAQGLRYTELLRVGDAGIQALNNHGQPESVVTAMRGGLGIISHTPDNALIYRAIEIAPMRVVIALPTLPDFEHQLRNNLPPRVVLADAVHNIGQTALLIEALRTGDSALLKRTLSDRLHEPHRSESITGYHTAVQAGIEAGALGVTLCGAGPALLAFADFNHQMIEEAIRQAFQAAGITTRTWSTGVDMQGIVISVVQ